VTLIRSDFDTEQAIKYLHLEIEDRNGVSTHHCSGRVTIFIENFRHRSRVELDTQPFCVALVEWRKEGVVGALRTN